MYRKLAAPANIGGPAEIGGPCGCMVRCIYLLRPVVAGQVDGRRRIL